MNKSESKEVAKNDVLARQISSITDPSSREATIAYLARAYSALARASLRSRNEIITAAMCVPAIVQHHEFIV